ncbi:MAG: class I mannose-6-phosphate isomerase [Acidobacteriota bacterium]|nr:class I mannose-6-phosphate isomerase [Acidobacteriota bacterium]
MTMTTSKPGPLAPFRLTPWFSERVWGRMDLRPWYAETGTTAAVGEAWLTGAQCLVETGELAGRQLGLVAEEFAAELLGPDGGEEFPLLVKLLFPNDKLSVQVHPDDPQAQAMGQPRGKTECWYVLEAEPGATVALGLKAGVTLPMVEAAIADGTLEAQLNHVPVAKGDMIFVDAGTVHAIGPGVVLLETQQTSDTTFRMYDYGRPRELHVAQGLAVTKLTTRAGKVAPQPMDGFTRLIDEQYFTVDRFELAALDEIELLTATAGCLVGLSGTVNVITPDEEVELTAGQAVVLPVSCGQVILEAESDAVLLHCSMPA